MHRGELVKKKTPVTQSRDTESQFDLHGISFQRSHYINTQNFLVVSTDQAKRKFRELI